jgi:C-terminal processing protease CtpA/Prc
MIIDADMGMCLGLGVLVANITDDGLASKCGIKHGDQICQVC